MKLTNSVFLVGSGSGGIGLTNSFDCNVYLIDCGNEYILIDAGAGYNSTPLIEQILSVKTEQKPITKFLLTHHHGDHAGGARELSLRFGCNVYAPAPEVNSIIQGEESILGLDIARNAGFYPKDYHFTPCPVDVPVYPGDSIQTRDITIHVLDGAGHSMGGVCYYLKADRKQMLFCGDLLAFNGLISLQNIPGVNLASYSKSVLALEKLNVDCFFPGHGCFSLSDGHRHIRTAASAFRQLGIPKNTF